APAVGAHALRLPFVGDTNCRILVVLGGGTATNLIDPATLLVTAGPNLMNTAGNGSGAWVIPSGTSINDVLIVQGGTNQTSQLNVTSMTMSVGPPFPAVTSRALHLQVPSSGLLAGQEIIWYAGG